MCFEFSKIVLDLDGFPFLQFLINWMRELFLRYSLQVNYLFPTNFYVIVP